jgi:hypothetical protein
MIRKFWRRVSGPMLFAGLTAPFIANCGAVSKLPGGSNVPGAGGNCPDMAKVEAIDSFDFGKEFNLQADIATKIKTGAAAAAEMQELNAKIDDDLKTSCGNLAHDLGATGDYKSGQEACKAAEKAIGDVKAKLGASAKISLDVSPPHCGASVDAYADCSGHCDASVTPGKAEVKCEGGKVQGTCSGQCSGECEASAAAACSGECSGSCDAEIKGTCSGNCVGKCDGKATPAGGGAQCAGTCDGKCSGNVKAECKGKCGGSCKMKAQASCSGTCSGSCSVEMQAPKCEGNVEPPKMSAECKAKCDARVQAKAECTPPHIAFRIIGAADAQTSAKFKEVIEKDLPGVLTVSIGMAKHVGEVAANMEVVIQGVQAGIQGAGDPMTVGRLTACVGAPFKGALDAVANVKANVNVSVNVQASASASGSASGSASASGHAG